MTINKMVIYGNYNVTGGDIIKKILRIHIL